jgi:hypothetical protein
VETSTTAATVTSATVLGESERGRAD